MERVGEPVVSRGVVEQPFLVGDVPGVLWTPEGSEGARPLVLLGHGATLDKQTPYLVSLARRLVRHHGISAASVDFPGHGARVVGAMADIVSMWTKPEVTDQAVGELHAVLAALDAEGLGQTGLGYWGMSMGTLLGLPFVAAEPRIQVAVLGLAGLTGPPAARLAADAPRISCPVLFLQQWDDELFPRGDVLALFDAIGSIDKRLHVQPGLHSAVPLEEIEASEAFLAAYLPAAVTDAR
ncbi:MAG: alpha/beta hydrolase [Actinobacteria bacterium]|nr:alpha/beta hydrolase [Actinomycetota bacterium]